MRTKILLQLFGLTAFLGTALNTSADVRLPALFSDNMVLQCGTQVAVWGWADDGEKVSVIFRDQKASTVAKNGKWTMKLSALKAGGPGVLKVTGNNSIELKNVLVGEVWVCSGQSNMEWSLKKSFKPETDIATSGNDMLRFFVVPNRKANEPMDDVTASWTSSTPKTSPDFSAVGYFFGRDLQKSLGVPVGLIQSDWGGSPIEVWMSREALENNASYKKDILDNYIISERNYQNALAKFKAGTGVKNAPRAPWKPSELYNGMVTPLQPYAIQGVIWYQGEANAGRAHQYQTLFPDMIRNWRRDWCDRDFSFLAVQLAPYKAIKDQPGESDWAELREAQLLATKVMPKVGLAVITDVGEQKDIHPTKKEAVGQRLALAARGITYGEEIVYSGPVYKKMNVKGNRAILSFDHVGSGLKALGGTLTGFSICGEDKNFIWANAEIEGDKIVVSSPEVAKPVAVRYGWADFPVVNLWNKDGLPASPFRTDDFPMITAPKE